RLTRVLVAVVVSCQVGEQEKRRRRAGVPGKSGGDRAQGGACCFGAAQCDLRARPLILRGGSKICGGAYFGELGRGIGVSSQSEEHRAVTKIVGDVAQSRGECFRVAGRRSLRQSRFTGSAGNGQLVCRGRGREDLVEEIDRFSDIRGIIGAGDVHEQLATGGGSRRVVGWRIYSQSQRVESRSKRGVLADCAGVVTGALARDGLGPANPVARRVSS